VLATGLHAVGAACDALLCAGVSPRVVSWERSPIRLARSGVRVAAGAAFARSLCRSEGSQLMSRSCVHQPSCRPRTVSGSAVASTGCSPARYYTQHRRLLVWGQSRGPGYDLGSAGLIRCEARCCTILGIRAPYRYPRFAISLRFLALQARVLRSMMAIMRLVDHPLCGVMQPQPAPLVLGVVLSPGWEVFVGI